MILIEVEFDIKRALISVYDKTRFLKLVEALEYKGVEIISSGGTARIIKDAGFNVVEVSDFTGSREIFGGRVKTLHPRIHGGILMRRDSSEDMREAEMNGILPIDLVVVNLYPFIEKASEGVPEKEAVELIDIGGVALLRAAAKNFQYTAVLHSPAQYDEFIEVFSSEEGIGIDLRRKWAGEAFAHTAEYDAVIQNYFAGGEGDLFIIGHQPKKLRYGENPHQRAVMYSLGGEDFRGWEQLHGKGLSYVNALDFDAAVNIAGDFEEPACVIIKHNTPCGLAVGGGALEAYLRAFSCDIRSPFGGIAGFNLEVDGETAVEISKIFLEGIIAPGFSEEALKTLRKKKNLRIMVKGMEAANERGMRFTSIDGGFLVQDSDSIPIHRGDFEVVTKIKPTDEQWEALLFGAKAVKWAKSNAVVFNNRCQTLGIGCGQTSRVGAVEIASANAKLFGHSLKGAVMASDAFFPFPDSVEEAAKAGIKGVVQPGGSIRDEEVIKAADELGITMVFTGKRHFRH